MSNEQALLMPEDVHTAFTKNFPKSRISHAWINFAADIHAAIVARQALALPTADHLPDARVMIETAAPVGEREAFGYFYIVNGVHEGFCKGVEPPPDDSYDEGMLVPVYRSALSAGDAVDAQRYRLVRRGQHFSVINGIGDTLRGEALDAAADAAMRKGQL